MAPIWINALAVVRAPAFVIMIMVLSEALQVRFSASNRSILCNPNRRNSYIPGHVEAQILLKLPGIKHVAIYAPFSHALFNMKLVLCCLFLLFFLSFYHMAYVYILSSSGVADRFSELSSTSLGPTQRQQYPKYSTQSDMKFSTQHYHFLYYLKHECPSSFVTRSLSGSFNGPCV